tara:strand:+ start:164 stop:550 length:387 start_codon:yes stop_codon:yes gene_type:complete
MKVFALLALFSTAATMEQKSTDPNPRWPKYLDGEVFMNSVMNNYCSEGADKDGNPTGVFTMNESQFKALSKEVLGTHKGIKGDKFNTYFDTYGAKAFGHFDVNKTGAFACVRAAEAERFLASDQYMQL